MSNWPAFEILVLAAGLALRLAVAWMPVQELIARTIPDDAFIYFVIARHIAAGLGATFDGVTLTNGFHPLWALALAPIFGVFPQGDLPIHLALTVSAICDTAAGALAGWVVWRASPAQSRSYATTITMALYLFNPRAILESANGLETGLGMLTLAACVTAWQLARESFTARRAMIFGALAGLTLLARSDLGVIVAVLWMSLLARLLLTRATRLQAVWLGMLPIAAAFLVVAPWFIWSQLQVGTMVQSSGVAIPSLVAYTIQNADGQRVWDALLFPIINFSFRNTIIYPGAALIVLVIATILNLRNHNSNSNSNYLWLPTLGALLVILIHTVVRWYPRGWYFAPLAWGAALAVGPAAVAGLTTPLGKKLAVWIWIGIGAIILAQGIKIINEPELKWQADMAAGARWLAANTSPDDTIGAFNAGIYAYYSDRRVLSLDGLVDWGAIEARREKRLLDYFVARGGALLIDHREYIWNSFSPFFGDRSLELAAELPVADSTYGPIVVYRVR
jgi:hypothetical protein